MAHGKSLRDRDQGIDPTSIETEDEGFFFRDHPDRKYRIRLPRNEREYQNEFQSLGPHQFDRRRIIVARTPPGAAIFGVHLMPIPFLAFADETIEDRDDILGPIFKGIMENAGANMGLGGKSGWW